jgi:hypothetical protein
VAASSASSCAFSPDSSWQLLLLAVAPHALHSTIETIRTLRAIVTLQALALARDTLRHSLAHLSLGADFSVIKKKVLDGLRGAVYASVSDFRAFHGKRVTYTLVVSYMLVALLSCPLLVSALCLEPIFFWLESAFLLHSLWLRRETDC